MRAAPTPPDPYQAILQGIAAARVDDAAAARTRAHWLARQAEEGATLLGALCDLVEQRRPVRCTLRGGHEVRGRLHRADADHVEVHHPGGVTHLRTPALARVLLEPVAAPDERHGVPTRRDEATAKAGSAAPQSPDTARRTFDPAVRTFDTVLRDAAAERDNGVLLTDDGGEHPGRLRAVGVDVITLRAGEAGALRGEPGVTSTLLVALRTVVAVRFPHDA